MKKPSEILDEHFKTMGAELHESHRTFVLFVMKEYKDSMKKYIKKQMENDLRDLKESVFYDYDNKNEGYKDCIHDVTITLKEIT